MLGPKGTEMQRRYLTRSLCTHPRSQTNTYSHIRAQSDLLIVQYAQTFDLGCVDEYRDCVWDECEVIVFALGRNAIPGEILVQNLHECITCRRLIYLRCGVTNNLVKSAGGPEPRRDTFLHLHLFPIPSTIMIQF